jgi:hypothetical protein
MPASANNPANYSIAGVNITGAQLQVDNQTVILTTSALVDNQAYTLLVNGVAPAGTNPIAPNLQFTFYAGTGVGLRGDYYDNSNFTGTLLTRTDPQVNFAWGNGSPDPSIGVETFSIRWTGFVRAQFTELYTFTTTTDDGVRLWINDTQIIDKWIDQGDTDWSGSFALVAGQKYSIKMEFYENGGGATAKLAWSSPSTPKQFIPTAQLFLPPATPPKISIGDVSLAEGNSGNKAFVFPVTLDGPNIVPITVSYTTAGAPTGSAVAGVDYTAASGVLTIPTGALSGNITVQVAGDVGSESNETFVIKLSAPTNATILDDQAQGTILDDDTITTSVAARQIVYNNSSFYLLWVAGGSIVEAAIDI